MTRIAIIGAGIVGICCAIALADQGHEVALIDRSDPGQQTSRWNAGVLATSSIIPLNNPGIFANLPRLLMGRHPGFRLDIGAATKLLPWAVRFLNNSRTARSEHSIAALSALIGHSRQAHERLCARINYRDLHQNGWLMLYRGETGVQRAALQAQTLNDRRVDAQVLKMPELADIEPGLKGVFSGALHITQSAHTNPAALTAAYLALAKSLGVIVLQENVGQVRRSGSGLEVVGSSAPLGRFDRVVLTLGPWSNDILGQLGKPLPLAIERGYLQLFEGEGVLNRPFLDIDGGYVAAPRPDGVQISTGTELTSFGTHPRPQRMDAALRAAQEALTLGAPLLKNVAVGNRPSLPDSLPVIGPIRAVPGLWIATGHQHVGFSTSAGTASLLASMMADQPAPIDPRSFSPKRFGL